MLSNSTLLETRIQRLLNGLIFVEKGHRVHVLRRLKMCRVSTLAEQNICQKKKKTKENWGPYIRLWFDKITVWCQLNFYQNILCDHCLRDLHLYIWKILTNREMVNFQKWDFFRFFFKLLL